MWAMTGLPAELDQLFVGSREIEGPVVVLTGAGISAESGIPTFRGPEGYWQIGSRNYHPMELATFEAYNSMPDDVWSWYLYRRGVCRAAEPNAAHRAVADLEHELGDDMLLITQNVDGLHLRAGSTLDRTYQIHGNIDFMRCGGTGESSRSRDRPCTPAAWPLPDGVDVAWGRGRPLGESERALLVCPKCKGRARPHVLWFDEYYDETHFRFESSLRAAGRARLLVVVGTTGQTNLPLHVGGLVARRGAPMIVVNPEASPFTAFATESPFGAWIEGTAGDFVPPLFERLAAELAERPMA